MRWAEQLLQHIEGLGGNKFSANLMPGKAAAFEEQHARAALGGCDGGSTTGWPASYHHQVINHFGLWRSASMRSRPCGKNSAASSLYSLLLPAARSHAFPRSYMPVEPMLGHRGE